MQGSGAEDRVELQPLRSGNREFLVVAVIAVLILLLGAWWIVKTRAENAERARIEAAAFAEAERVKAEEIRRLAEEKARRDALAAELRGRLAVHKTNWALVERELAAAERRANTLRSDARGLNTKADAPQAAALLAEAAAHSELARWLETVVLGGAVPANLAKLDAQLSGMLLDEAAATEVDLAAELTTLAAESKAKREKLLNLEGPFTLHTEPTGLPVTIRDAYGRLHEGTSPFNVRLPWGLTVITAAGPTEEWHPQSFEFNFNQGSEDAESISFEPTSLVIQASPKSPYVLTFESGKQRKGTTPVSLTNLPRGKAVLEIAAPNQGWKNFRQEIVLGPETPQVSATFTGGLALIDSAPSGLAFTAKHENGAVYEGKTPATIFAPPGKIEAEVARSGWGTRRIEGKIAPRLSAGRGRRAISRCGFGGGVNATRPGRGSERPPLQNRQRVGIGGEGK